MTEPFHDETHPADDPVTVDAMGEMDRLTAEDDMPVDPDAHEYDDTEEGAEEDGVTPVPS